MPETRLRLAFSALDTLFFGTGQPFHQNDAGAAIAHSLFPPYPPAVVGAARVALARQSGWTGGNWSGTPLADLLGDGPSLGRLRFRGPFLRHAVRDRETGEVTERRYLVPTPSTIRTVRRGTTFEPDPRGHDPTGLSLLSPAEPAVVADLASHLPSFTVSANRKDVRGDVGDRIDHWLTLDGLMRHLDGDQLQDRHFVPRHRGPEPVDTVALGREPVDTVEWRTGIERSAASRTARIGRLYSVGHRRLAEADEMVLLVEGVDEEEAERWSGRTVLPLGGEGGLSALVIDRLDDDDPLATALDAAPHQVKGGRYRLIALTPLLLDGDTRPEMTLTGDGAPLPGRLVAAAHDQPVLIGGWRGDGRSASGNRHTFGRALPAGSTLFMELEDRAAAATVGRGPIGRHTGWGFGVVAVGHW